MYTAFAYSSKMDKLNVYEPLQTLHYFLRIDIHNVSCNYLPQPLNPINIRNIYYTI